MSMPPIRRSSMLARPWTGLWRGLLIGLVRQFVPARPHMIASDDPPQPWERAAKWRRRLLLLLVVLSSAVATIVFERELQPLEGDFFQWSRIGLFALLFAWVSAGFWTAVMGFFVLVFGDRHTLRWRDHVDTPIDARARSAIIMPICNEHVATVFAGLRATLESLAATGRLDLFDFFVLSDSNDADIRTAELAAWARLREDLGADGERVFYRWRQRRTKRKAGNVADFCRRWGRAYRYMVVLDADSVMSGECLLAMVGMMEGNPRAGIIQTAPQSCGHDTMYARAQQFSSRVAGSVFTAGMQYWQLGESHYWGHNAIIRVAPFIQYCALAPVGGREIMSHDFVEAALMRRAGFHVWVVRDLPGSFEQQPPHLLAELQRDRRWCQGNLQNARLFAEPGLHAVHRAMLLTGAMAYVSAPLWLLFLVLSIVAWAVPLDAAWSDGASLLWLWCAAMGMLMLPRALGVAAIALRGEQAQYGGLRALARSTVMEALLSVFQAPIRMIAHTMFVVGAMTGLRIEWKSPPREANALPWRDALNQLGVTSVIAIALTVTALYLDAASAVWLLPVLLPIVLSIPTTVLTSKVEVGRDLRRRATLLIPEEAAAPAVLRRAEENIETVPATAGWRDVLADVWLLDVVLKALGQRDTSRGVRGRERRRFLRSLSISQAPDAVPAAARMRLLSEPDFLVQLCQRTATTHFRGPLIETGTYGVHRTSMALGTNGRHVEGARAA